MEIFYQNGVDFVQPQAAKPAGMVVALNLENRMDVTWNPDDYSIEDLVVFLGEKDMNTIKLICEKTKEAAEVARAMAVEGGVVALAAILVVAAEKINDSILEFRDSDSGSKEKMTIYECVIREALSFGRATSSVKESEDSKKRKDKSALKVAKRKLGTHKREKKRSTLIFYAKMRFDGATKKK
ncbi:hypothetical protein G4B88_001875 [Cannabis sativa]|uniref:Uncharacterized protein n=1 Tax=Cannabis sativa TaxID=3483 RepID=A0A7J6HE55_CANSA|nr:hypothetical protein G4B88_001875 [Cannabis sativa]